jgi:phosphoheptose isomerase
MCPIYQEVFWMKRKIAMITNSNSLLASLGSVGSGGQEVYIAQVARNLDRMGYQVDIFTRKDDPELPEIYEWLENVRIIHVPAGPAEFLQQEDLLVYMPEFTEYMIEFFNRQMKPYDLIHANFGMSGLIGAEIKVTLGTPFVIEFHALGRVRPLASENDRSFSARRFEIEDRIVREADGIIAESQQDREELISLYHADPTYIAQIPCGCPSSGSWRVDQDETTKQTGFSEGERLSGERWLTWQSVTSSLTEFYEDVLAIRRVMILPMGALPLDLNQGNRQNQLGIVEQTFESALQIFQETRETLGPRVLEAAYLMIACLSQGGRIVVCGDGRNTTNAQDFAAELAGDFIIPGSVGSPVLHLSTDQGFLTNGSNDASYDQALAMQVQALGRPGDLLVGISTAGDSTDLVEAFQYAQSNNINCLSLSGTEDGALASVSNVALIVPSSNAQRVQEVHTLLLHLLCNLVGEYIQGGLQFTVQNFRDAAHAIPPLDRLAE